MITAYTDGSCDLKTKKGGWGVYTHHTTASGLVFEWEDWGGCRVTSSGNAEVMALYKCLSSIPLSSESVVIWCDNEYVVKTLVSDDGVLEMSNGKVMYTGYMRAWLRNGWKKADKSEPKHRDLWTLIDSELLRLLRNGVAVTLKWMESHGKNKGHPGNSGNARADTLASRGRTEI